MNEEVVNVDATVKKPIYTGIEALVSLAITILNILEEEEEKLKKEFPGVKIIRSGGIPAKATVIYDFVKLDKKERYKLFEFERRLVDRLESSLREFLGEDPPFSPIEVEFIRKA